MSKKWFGIVFQTLFLLSSLARSCDIQASLKDFVITSAFGTRNPPFSLFLIHQLTLKLTFPFFQMN